MSKLPIAPMRMPSTLLGKQNGKLPAHLLTEIGVGSARMEITAARSFRAIFADARKHGFNIRHVGDYRSFDAQLSLFLSRYEPVSLAVYTVTSSGSRKKWSEAKQYGYTSIYWRKKTINGKLPATAATPGNSNHGWGLALDIAEEYDNDSAPDPIRQVFVNWLINNARRYGISAELQSEPWHWRYVAGDSIPLATLHFEQGTVQPVEPVPNPVHPEPGPALVFAYPGKPLRLGSRGVAVELIQAEVGAKPDGDFGPATERRVKAWQKANKLKDDGVVGSVTWKRMFG